MKMSEQQLRNLIRETIRHDIVSSHTRGLLLRHLIAENIRMLHEEDKDEEEEDGFFDRVGRAVSKTVTDYGQAAYDTAASYGDTAANLALSGVAAVADTISSPAHAPESSERAKKDQAAWEKRRIDRVKAVGEMAKGVLLLKHKLGAKLAASLGQEKVLRDAYGDDIADELLAGSMLHDVLMAASFVPAATVPAMVLDSVAYAAEGNKEAAILAIAMAGVAQVAKPSASTGIPKGATKVLSSEVKPLTLEDFSGFKKYDDVAAAAASGKPAVSLNYRIVCEACWRVPTTASERESAAAAARSIGSRMEQAGFPGAQGIGEAAAQKINAGEFNIGVISDSVRMAGFNTEANYLMAPNSSGVNLLQRSRRIIDEAKLRAQQSVAQGAENIRNPMDRKIAQQSSIHAETGTAEVPMLPDESVSSSKIADQSRAELRRQGVPEDQLVKGDTDAAIVGLSRYGITLESAYTSCTGRKCVIIKTSTGKRYAYYRSTGTGSGTPEGLLVPYHGTSFVMGGETPHLHIAKMELPGGMGRKIPFVGSGEARTVFDAINHPFIRDNVMNASSTGAFNRVNIAPETNNFNLSTVRQFVSDIYTTAGENQYLHSMGVDIMPEGTMPTAVFPWPDNAPVPPNLRGRTLTPSEFLDGVSLNVQGSERLASGTYSLRKLFSLNSSILDKQNVMEYINKYYSFNPYNLNSAGGVVTRKF